MDAEIYPRHRLEAMGAKMKVLQSSLRLIMKRCVDLVVLVLVVTIGPPGILMAQTASKDTRFLSQPAISKSQIAFVYAGDLWTADLDGKNVRRLTSDDGIESNPVFSPNGELIAFSAQYDGNTDVYIVPVEGGIPERLTWHPDSDIVRGFTLDGSAVLFISPRFDFSGRYTRLFTVPVAGAFPEVLEIPNAFKATYSPDGKRMAYNPNSENFRQWKNYRGGTVSKIWLFTFDDHSVERIPQPEGRSNDIDAMWIGDRVYFLSDRNGEFNLFYYDVQSSEIEQLTQFTDFPILHASAGDNKIIFEQAGGLQVFDLQDARSKKLSISVTTDLPELRRRYVKGSHHIRDASISPSGARAVFDFRGEIITVPAEKGDPRNLSNTTGAHERSPAWSPDGKSIAYFSDETGEYQLYIKQHDGKGKRREFEIEGSGIYSRLIWSPDSKKMTFTDNARNLYLIELENGKSIKIASEYRNTPDAFGTIRGIWSPDSKWIAYTLDSAALIKKVYIYSIENQESYPITDGLSEVSDPVFDESGKYIYFFASTDAGPINNWFAMSTTEMRSTRAIYLATLQKDLLSPLAKESDEEEGVGKEEEDEKDESRKVSGKTLEAIAIDFDGLNNRIVSLPVEAGNLFSLQVGDEGQIYYLQAPASARDPEEEGAKLHRYDLREREDKIILSGVNSYQLSENKKQILYRAEEAWNIVPSPDTAESSCDKAESGKGELNIDAVQVHIDPKAEWNQIFHEAWRINRDYFYATNMHGADWEAMLQKYRVFLPHLASRSDLNRLIQWMCSELAVGHHDVDGGDYLHDPETIPGGLLGADYSIENGRYRFTKVYGGLNWNPELRSPLTEPGMNIKQGEYLLAVNGRELTSSTNLYRLFENTSGKIVEISVGPNPNSKGSRIVSVVPVANEGALRNRDWVEGNLKKVDEATGGRVAYVYVPDTATEGLTYFKRYFFPQADRDAIIVDERFNGGGDLPDYYIDILRRPFVANWHMRYGVDLTTPSGAILGPKVMLIDEEAGSGGDLLPFMFRKNKMGTLIGKSTWGGLVGTLGFPVLMDGGTVSAPNLAIWDEDGWVVENVGVPPDIEVEQWPADVIAGHDPQLEKAIEVILDELKKNPPKKMQRPPYPVRAK